MFNMKIIYCLIREKVLIYCYLHSGFNVMKHLQWNFMLKWNYFTSHYVLCSFPKKTIFKQTWDQTLCKEVFLEVCEKRMLSDLFKFSAYNNISNICCFCLLNTFSCFIGLNVVCMESLILIKKSSDLFISETERICVFNYFINQSFSNSFQLDVSTLIT